MATVYSIQKTDTNEAPFIINPSQIDGFGGPQSNTSLILHGTGRLRYGEALNENLLHLLENFSSPAVALPIVVSIQSADNNGGVGTHFITFFDDKSDIFIPSYSFQVVGSTSNVNDNTYTVVSSSYSQSTNLTTVVLAENFPDDFAAFLGNVSYNVVEPDPTMVKRPYNEGQLWHNKSDNLLYIYKDISGTGIFQWGFAGKVGLALLPPLFPTEGDLWFDPLDEQLKIYHNGSFISIADRYVLKAGDTMDSSAVLSFGNNLYFNEGMGSVGLASDIRATGSMLISAEEGLHINIDNDNTGTGSFRVNKGSPSTTGDVDLFGIGIDGLIRSYISNYETLVTFDDAIPNKKYVDDSVSGLGSNFVNVAGDTMTGSLILNADPSVNLGAATKQYVDSSISTLGGAAFVNVSGDTMTGFLNLNANPTSTLHAATKGYVDTSLASIDHSTFVLKAGDTLSGVHQFGSHLLFNEGNGSTGIGPDIRATSNMLQTAMESFHINIDDDNNGAGSFRIGKGSQNTTSDIDLFRIENDGTITSEVTNYETLVISNNDIPNKKYVDDQIASFTPGNKVVSSLVKSGYNHMAMIIDGLLYTTSGSQSGAGQYGYGRGSTAHNVFWGMDNLKHTPIFSTGIPIQTGGNGLNVAWALLDNQNLYTWGLNQSGGCGLGHTSAVTKPTLAATGVTDVYDHPSTGTNHPGLSRLIIRRTDGFLYGCGYNLRGQLGLSNTTQQNSFVQLTTFGNSIQSAWNMGCHVGCLVVQKSDDTIWVSGYNGFGQLGTGTTATTVSTPVNVTSNWNGGAGYELKQVIGGFGHTGNDSSVMGMFLDNGTTTRFRMSGHGGFSAMGDGSTTNNSTPTTPNVGTGRIAEVACIGAIGPIQVLKEDNNLYTWGRASEGALGNGTNSPNVSTPFITRTGVIKLFSDGMTSFGNGFLAQAFIKQTNNLIYGCGYNAGGYVGYGSTASSRNSWIEISLPRDADIVEMGHYITFDAGRVQVARGSNNKLYTWGYNQNLGVGGYNSAGANALAPVQVQITQDNT